MPGLLAGFPPRKVARGRETDRFVMYLAMSGTAGIEPDDCMKIIRAAADKFYETSGALTTAMRAATEIVNNALLERNMPISGRGQYMMGAFGFAVLRDTQLTLLLSGNIHAYIFQQDETRHVHEPSLSGRGLGLSRTAQQYFTQYSMQANDRVMLCAKVPNAWQPALESKEREALEATRRRLITLTNDDLNAALFQTMEGTGTVSVLQTTNNAATQSPDPKLARPPEQESQPEPVPAHHVQPSAYAIPIQKEEPIPEQVSAASHEFPPSIPRVVPREETPPAEPIIEKIPEIVDDEEPTPQKEPSEQARKMARTLAGSIQASRRVSEKVSVGAQKFLPRLLPNSEVDMERLAPSIMFSIALIVPILVGVMALVVYIRYGRSVQYDESLAKARDARAEAIKLSDPIAQRDAWESVLLYVRKAEEFRETTETSEIRQEAEGRLDILRGITRLDFHPTFSSGLRIEISRMAASETDLYMLDARTGSVAHAAITNSGFQSDPTFNCAPGPYGSYQVGPLVDILAMPILNSINAAMVGIDGAGNLLYCAPGQVAQAIPLAPPPTNWGRVTAIYLDSGNLYVMDAQSRAIWVYVGRDGAFIDSPYFFFGGQIPEIQDAIDLAVSGNDLYILHAGGRISTCSYSRVESVPTRCQETVSLVNPFPAYRDTDLFAGARITQMVFTALPDQSILLLDADSQAVFRIAPRTMELQNQLRPINGKNNSVPAASIGAMAVSPNHILYLAVEDNVYFATDMP